MQLEIITPEKIVVQQEIDEVLVPTSEGQIAILPHHVNLVTKVQQGELIIKYKSQEQYLAVTAGFLEVANNKITILSDYAVRAEDIETEKVLAAQKKAEEILKNSKEHGSDRDFALAENELRRSILQLDVAGRRRRRNN